MGKKFVKTTFAILSFMMLLPTSVFAEDAGNMEAAFVGESVLEADQSASYSDADSTLPFEEEKNNPTDEKIPETEEQTPEKTDSENQNSDLDGFISGDASAEDEKKTIHVIIENGNTDTDNGTQITDPVIDSGDYSAGEYSGGGSSASSSGEKILHKPQVLLEDNNLSGQNLKAGSVTEMSLTFRNKSRSQNVFGLKISISADTKGIEFERNSFYVQRLTPGEAITLKQKVTIAEDCTPGQATVSFSLDYEDSKATGATGTETLSFQITQPARLGTLEAGTAVQGSLRVYVKGKSEEDDGSFPGRITGKLILTYEDAAGNSYEESTEFESEIKEAKIQSLKIEDDQEETNNWWYSVIAVIAVLLVSVILLLLGKLHKKNILLEETRKVDAH